MNVFCRSCPDDEKLPISYVVVSPDGVEYACDECYAILASSDFRTMCNELGKSYPDVMFERIATDA